MSELSMGSTASFFGSVQHQAVRRAGRRGQWRRRFHEGRGLREPPLRCVLVESRDRTGRMNHEHAPRPRLLHHGVERTRHFAHAPGRGLAPVVVPHVADDQGRAFGIPRGRRLANLLVTARGAGAGAQVQLQRILGCGGKSTPPARSTAARSARMGIAWAETIPARRPLGKPGCRCRDRSVGRGGGKRQATSSRPCGRVSGRRAPCRGRWARGVTRRGSSRRISSARLALPCDRVRWASPADLDGRFFATNTGLARVTVPVTSGGGGATTRLGLVAADEFLAFINLNIERGPAGGHPIGQSLDAACPCEGRRRGAATCWRREPARSLGSGVIRWLFCGAPVFLAAGCKPARPVAPASGVYGALSNAPVARVHPPAVAGEPWTNGPLAVIESALSPAVLFHSPTRSLSFFTDTPGTPSSAPAHVCISTEQGPKIFQPGAVIDPARMRESWFVAWWSGRTGGRTGTRRRR